MSRFGWCATGHHDGCPFEYEHWYQKGEMIRCECECHGEPKEEVQAGGEGVPSGESGRAKKDSGAAGDRPAPAKQSNPRGARKKSSSND